VNRFFMAKMTYEDNDMGKVRELLLSCSADLRGWEWYRLWHLTDQAHMTLFRAIALYSKASGHACFTSDGKHIISGGGGERDTTAGEGKTIKIWDADTGAEIRTLMLPERRVSVVGFSPNGKRIVSSSWDGTIKIWDAETGAEVISLPGHKRSVGCVSFSPNGKRMVSASLDKTLKVWDADTGAEVMTIRGHQSEVYSVAFGPDGRRIISGGRDKNSQALGYGDWGRTEGSSWAQRAGYLRFFQPRRQPGRFW